MSRIIPFSRLRDYFESGSRTPSFVPGVILDTNVLITMSYEVKPLHEEVIELLDTLEPFEPRFFATVTTKSEYLDFYRRLAMTEILRGAVRPESIVRLTARAKAAIQTVSGRLTQRESRGGDPVFNDSDLKEIKQAFSAGSASGRVGWLELCQGTLPKRLAEAEATLADLGIEYVSQHNAAQKDLFHKMIDWPDAMAISARSCVGFSDAMILNALKCSHLPLLISLDFDMGYAALSDPTFGKDVAMPDELVKEFRGYHFEDRVSH
jgi:hypothetical protein